MLWGAAAYLCGVTLRTRPGALCNREVETAERARAAALLHQPQRICAPYAVAASGSRWRTGLIADTERDGASRLQRQLALHLGEDVPRHREVRALAIDRQVVEQARPGTDRTEQVILLAEREQDVLDLIAQVEGGVALMLRSPAISR